MEKIEGRELIFEWVKLLLIALIIAFIIRTFIFDVALVRGDSMLPTLRDGNRVVISLLANDYNKGDIVIMNAPYEKDTKYVKRIIGLPGDKIKISDGKVSINGKALEENYIEEEIFTNTYGEDSWEVKDGEVFVLGDNRVASSDSRIFGVVSANLLEGKVRFLPLFNK